MAKGSIFAVSSQEVNSSLATLFTSSAGPVELPKISRYASVSDDESTEPSDAKDDVSDTSDNESRDADRSDGSNDSNEGDELGQSSDSESEDTSAQQEPAVSLEDVKTASQKSAVPIELQADTKRKRKKRDQDENLEARYLLKLVDKDEPQGKRHKAEVSNRRDVGVQEEDQDSSDAEIPVHETQSADNPAAADFKRASQTVFLSNVAVSAITDRKAKKTLIAHLSSVLDKTTNPRQSIESIRFRSTAFSSAGIPKRVAYIKKEVLDSTTKSTNAYVVYPNVATARAAASKLNGTVILDRHLRVDSVAHPAPIDHHRCIFVGNLGFVDDESVITQKIGADGKEVMEKKKRSKVPMDVEEGLWRVFCKEAGKVESVRVVRDPATRVGKGFAYVQFYDANSVEAALVLADKKFPPMLPRRLRVSRCKAPHKTARALEAKRAKNFREAHTRSHTSSKGATKDSPTSQSSTQYVPKTSAESQTAAGRAGKLFGRSGARAVATTLLSNQKVNTAKGEKAKTNKKGTGQGDDDRKHRIKPSEKIVFEGIRATAGAGRPRDLKLRLKSKHKRSGGRIEKKKKAKLSGKRAQRAADWKKAKRDEAK